MKGTQQIITKVGPILVSVFLVGDVTAQTSDKQDLEAARQEFEQSSRDEMARVTYVTKLAQIADRLVSEYRQSGQRHDELMGAINSELQKHPAPKDIDSKKLRQLLVGKWESPRHVYVYRANGGCGTEGGPRLLKQTAPAKTFWKTFLKSPKPHSGISV
jgi:hypothetical protein